MMRKPKNERLKITQQKARSPLVSLISSTEPSLGNLPLVHTSDAYRLRDILEAGRLLPTPCRVFGEDLLYMFLGRPAYRTRKQTNDNIHYDLPVVLVLKPEAELPVPKRIFPFDTGAYDANLYKKYFHPDTKMEDFDLGTNIEIARRYISFFYITDRDYFIGSTRKNVNIPFGSFEAEGLHELARAPADPTVETPTPPDERSSSIEIQYASPIELVGNILAVIIPQQYMDNVAVAKAIEHLSPVHLRTYEVINKMGSRELAGSIYEIVRQVYKDSGYL